MASGPYGTSPVSPLPATTKYQDRGMSGFRIQSTQLNLAADVHPCSPPWQVAGLKQELVLFT